jgi:hypothetical protein
VTHPIKREGHTVPHGMACSRESSYPHRGFTSSVKEPGAVFGNSQPWLDCRAGLSLSSTQLVRLDLKTVTLWDGVFQSVGGSPLFLSNNRSSRSTRLTISASAGSFTS